MEFEGTSASSPFVVTQEEFNIFHSIDRTLFARLVQTLGRVPGEATRVIALWIYLERASSDRRLFARILDFPDHLLAAACDEAVHLLCSLEFERFDEFIPPGHCISVAPIPFAFFHSNRVAILNGVEEIVNRVCVRAFRDLVNAFRESTWQSAIGRGDVAVGQFYYPCDMDMGSEGGANLEDAGPPDERTIFLTFSKGYPISEAQVREFFTLRFGDCISTIHMQEVKNEEQPLYARMVVKTPEIMEMVLEGEKRVKFSIEGKHLWARKYVRKTRSSPMRNPQPISPTRGDQGLSCSI